MELEKEIRDNSIPDILCIINEYAQDREPYENLINELKFKHNVYNEYVKKGSYSEHYFFIYKRCIHIYKRMGLPYVTV